MSGLPVQVAAAASGPLGEDDTVGSGVADPPGSSETVGSGLADGPGLWMMLGEAVALGAAEPVDGAGVTEGDATDAPQPTATSAITTANTDERISGRGAPDTHTRAGFTR